MEPGKVKTTTFTSHPEKYKAIPGKDWLQRPILDASRKSIAYIFHSYDHCHTRVSPLHARMSMLSDPGGGSRIWFTKRRIPMEQVKITCLKNGPYEVEGELSITDSNGKVVSSPGRHTYHLCRCGGSATKPFCDGTHERAHFKSE